MMKRLKAIMKNQVGLTLIELMIALAITGIITATVTMLTFQVFDGEARANNQLDAISRVQNAGREISRDAAMAQSVIWTDDADGLPLTLTWTDWEASETHTVVYSIVENNLRKVHSSDSGDVEYTFEYIISVDPDTEELVTFFDHTDFTFTLTATAGIGGQRVSETREYKTAPRPSL
jgi:prepilin-type N-terminal cleavage/methylation domain-containing protein